MKIENEIYMLEIESNTTGKPTTIYPTLIVHNDSLILIDTGFPGVLIKFVKQLRKKN
jgi:hypothetical protein